jgi:hypothetical protein
MNVEIIAETNSEHWQCNESQEVDVSLYVSISLLLLIYVSPLPIQS